MEKQKYRMPGDILEVLNSLKKDKSIILVTPLQKEKERLKREIRREGVVVMGVKEAIQTVKRGEAAPKCVVVDSYELVRELGLFKELENIFRDKVVIVTENEEETEELEGYVLVKQEKKKGVFYVSAESELERMAVLFSITKMKPVRGVCVVVETQKEARKVSMFLKAFGVYAEESPGKIKDRYVGIYLSNELQVQDYHLVVDMTGKVVLEKGILLKVGEYAKENESEKFSLLKQRAMSYRYRMESVLSEITPAIISGKKDFHMERFKHLQGPLRRMS